jgi:hypothetical protein
MKNSKIKIRQGSFDVAVKDGKETVQGYIYGPFGIQKHYYTKNRYYYSLTHLASGMGFGSLSESSKRAGIIESANRLLNTSINWDSPNPFKDYQESQIARRTIMGQ